MQVIFNQIGSRISTALIHLFFSIVSIAFIILFVAYFWFPSPFFDLLEISGLLILIIATHLLSGPFLTLVVWNKNKSFKERLLDASIVTIIQFAALGYGLWILAQVRPVFIVYEVDRFRVITPNEIAINLLSKENKAWRHSFFTKPQFISIREPINNTEYLNSIELSLSGFEPSTRPDWWQSYEKGRRILQQRMHPAGKLHQRSSVKVKRKLEQSLQEVGMPMDNVFFVPLVSARNLDSWVVLLDAQANVIGYAPVGGFE
ncbi:hypothetical protein [Comamonas jiangduensis]|uniref:Pilus assembly protein n=1 Tax=Comamonas jiangduensis TaxID=1194168 RepID=A0ABV4IE72_9BURK